MKSDSQWRLIFKVVFSFEAIFIFEVIFEFSFLRFPSFLRLSLIFRIPSPFEVVLIYFVESFHIYLIQFDLIQLILLINLIDVPVETQIQYKTIL